MPFNNLLMHNGCHLAELGLRHGGEGLRALSRRSQLQCTKALFESLLARSTLYTFAITYNCDERTHPAADISPHQPAVSPLSMEN